MLPLYSYRNKSVEKALSVLRPPHSQTQSFDSGLHHALQSISE
ncbi:hypothetical protein ACHAXS_010167, partial [Conticribra weissflogii]